MKRIKRTITMRKVEIISTFKNEHVDVCPLCHSQIIQNTKDSAIEIEAIESPLLIENKLIKELGAEKND